MKFFVVLAVVSLALPVEAAKKSTAKVESKSPVPVNFDIHLQSGWVRLSDTATSSGAGGTIESTAGLLAFGIGARVSPWRDLVVDVGYAVGGTTLESDVGTLSPSETGITWWELELLAGWRMALDMGPLRYVTPMGGYARERWSSEEQEPSQLTPSWTHNELRIGANAGLSLLDDKLPVTVGLFAAPLVAVSEDFDDSGNDPSGWGLDVSARADYDLGDLFGKFGNLWVGGQVGWGQRWIGFNGTGERLGADLRTPVRNVDESFGRIGAMLFVTWRHAAGSGGSSKTTKVHES